MTTWISAVMKNFDVPHNASGVIRVQCKHCETFISGTSTSAGNFMKHLKRKHLDTYLSLISMKYKYDSTVKSTKNHISSKSSSSQQDELDSTEGSPKKYTNYTEEFKLKVLEYYFQHGGENQYGLKSKTAQLFRMDKKTINRMLCNPEMVRKACKAINQKPPTVYGSSKQLSGGSSLSNDGHRTVGQNSAIIDLPEDPDFSVLKQAISSTVSGIGSVTRLLLTGTKDIKRIILEECDVIYECKVCRNLFRSLVNFLAHKRIYCEQQFVNVQNIFHKDKSGGLTTDSNTVIVEPEPPDDEMDGSKIDRIASKLASKSNISEKRIDQLSSSIHKGSSQYYDMIEQTQRNRNECRKDSSIILNRVSADSKIVYQDYVPHGQQTPVEGTKELATQAMENRMGVTAIIDENGKIIGTQTGTPSVVDMKNLKEIKNNSYLDHSPVESPCESPSIEENETDESDSYERTIHTCPICSTLFLSMGGCNKHLLKVHKKKKHQRERLRQVIASRTYTKVFTREGLKNYHLKSEARQNECLEASTNSSAEAKSTKLARSNIRTTECEVVQHREESIPKLQNLCIRCKKTFLTAGALGSHIKYCQFQHVTPKTTNEQPEKKIAIQIRKDYNKKDCMISTLCSSIVPSQVSNRAAKPEPTKEMTAEQKRILEEVEEKSSLLTDPGRLNCIPCKKKFPKKSTLQYHAAKHLNYNRYKCLNCEFRCYHRYTIARHCESSHLLSNCFHEEDKLGSFVYYLDDQSVPSDPPQDEDYKKLLNSVDDIKVELEPTQEIQPSISNDIKLDDDSDDEIVITNDCDPLAIESPSKEEVDTEICIVSEDIVDSSAKTERPQRQRRSIERKDFVYEIKHPQSVKTIEEEPVKQEMSSKRKGSPIEESSKKKISKTEDNLCNGKSSPKPRLHLMDESNQATIALPKYPDPPLSPSPE